MVTFSINGMPKPPGDFPTINKGMDSGVAFHTVAMVFRTSGFVVTSLLTYTSVITCQKKAETCCETTE